MLLPRNIFPVTPAHSVVPVQDMVRTTSLLVQVYVHVPVPVQTTVLLLLIHVLVVAVVVAK